MKSNCLKCINPTELENTLAEVFTRTHKCPWYKRLFNKEQVTFTYESKSESGIGLSKFVKCNKCGEIFDITDYNCW